jgi:nitrogen-specific signal transduction histidine kinase/integral membrane sensor domain MASE1
LRSLTSTRIGSDPRWLVAAAVAVFAGYYLAAQLGLMLRVASSTPSLLWPPNAFLTATLLLSPPRRWPLLLAAAAPAHFLVELQTEWPLSLITALFLTNCSEALLGAGGVWLFSRTQRRLDTLRAFLIFLASVVVFGPVVSSFFDAAAVAWLHGESYWEVWRARCLSNMLTELTVVPPIVGIVVHVLEDGPTSVRRYAEAALLTTGLVAAGFLFRRSPSPVVVAVSSYTPLVMQLPFVLWAAMRFGPAGVSTSLVVIAVTAIWTAAGAGPFDRLSPELTVSALQFFLIVLALPMLALSVMLKERRQTGRELLGRLRFEELLARLSGAFVQLPSDQMDVAFQSWMGRLGEFFELDCLTLFGLDARERDGTVVSTWAGPRMTVVPAIVARSDFPWGLDEILERRPVILHDVGALPAHAIEDRRSLQENGLMSALAFPLLAGDRVVGAMGFGAVTRRSWSEELIGQVRLTCEVMANALARKQTEDALRASEVMKGAILSSLSSGVAVLDRSGRGIIVNDTWVGLVRDSDMPCDLLRKGDNFLDVWREAGERGFPTANAIADGVQALLDGRVSTFRHEYAAAGDPHWFVVNAFPFNRPDGGAVVILSDVTDRRRAELASQRARDELAHVARVSTMGELSASMAHQLNQPLTGIMTNAQVALRMLDRAAVDFDQIRMILQDIVSDDRRASDVIRRLTALLRKGESLHEEVDVVATIREVVKLVSSDAIIRNVTIDVARGPEPLIVSGDRVQLQQVVLNLILNAMEAIGDHEIERFVWISSEASDGVITVTVRDSGVGLHHGADTEAFEPFYTTKPGGMGMGLSIARSIVEAHDGAICAGNSDSRGATVKFTLPLVRTAGARVSSSGAPLESR